MRLKVLVIRIVLGLVFAFFLTRLFFPAATKGFSLMTAGLLVFFAYLLEAIHRGSRGE